MDETQFKSLRRILLAVATLGIAALGLVLFHRTSHIVLTVFAGLLLGVILDGLAGFVSDRTPLSRHVALVLWILVILAAAFLFFWLAGPAVASQFESLGQQLPQILDQIRSTLKENRFGQLLLSQFSQQAGGIISQLAFMTTSFLITLVDAVVVLLIGVFFAFEAAKYKQYTLTLLPQNQRDRFDRTIEAVGRALRRWVWGRVIIMSCLGVLTWLGLMILGVPLAFLLGLITGVFSFVPFIGPIVAAVPAVLVGLSVSPEMAVYTLLVYTGVQMLENNILTPVIQKFVTALPPVLLISVQIVFGLLGGILGLLLATPLTVMIVVVVQTLYVQDVLKEKIKVLGESS